MDSLEKNGEELPKDYYNSIPVVYCKQCLSLRIRTLEDSMDYCDDCGSTDIEDTDIETWEKMYQSRYGKPYVNHK